MSDDSFFREVNEELRQDRVKAVWTRFGAYLLAAVILIIVITAAYVGWERYRTSQANAAGDQYLAALDLAQSGKLAEAETALQSIAKNGYGPYPDLARMSIGAVLEKQGMPQKAVDAFDEVAQDADAPQPLRDMASIRAGYILVDSGTPSQVRDRVGRLATDSDPLRFPAREAMALADWKAEDRETARKLFEQLINDSGTPNGISSRARLMLDLIKAGDEPSAAANGDTGPSAAPAVAGSNDATNAQPSASAAPSQLPGVAEDSASSGPAPATDDETRSPAAGSAEVDSPATTSGEEPDTGRTGVDQNAVTVPSSSATQNVTSAPEPTLQPAQPEATEAGSPPTSTTRGSGNGASSDSSPASSAPPATNNQ